MNGIQLNRRRFIVLANLLVNAIFYLNPLFSKKKEKKKHYSGTKRDRQTVTVTERERERTKERYRKKEI